MNKDLWFTCPVIAFTWQYIKNGGVGPEEVQVYEYNATRFTPILERMGAPMWGVAHLSDIPYVFRIPVVGAGADNSRPQMELSRMLSISVTRSVNARLPNYSESGVKATFGKATKKDLKEEFPIKLTLQLSGGPYGTKPVTLERKLKEENMSAEERAVA